MTATKRRTAPRVCSAPRCNVEIPRGKLMCREHWFQLPRLLRQAISAARKERRMRDWSANCLEARSYLASATPAAPTVSAERAFELNQRMMGDR